MASVSEKNGNSVSVETPERGGLAGSGLVLPHVPDWADPAWHLFVVRHPQRDALHKHLADAGIGS